MCRKSWFYLITELTNDWKLTVNRVARRHGCAFQPAINQKKRVKHKRSIRKINTHTRSQLALPLYLSVTLFFLYLCYKCMFLLYPLQSWTLYSSPFLSLRPFPVCLFFQQDPHNVKWSCPGRLSIDFLPGFQSDAKRNSRTSQCDEMAGCPLNTRAMEQNRTDSCALRW